MFKPHLMYDWVAGGVFTPPEVIGMASSGRQDELADNEVATRVPQRLRLPVPAFAFSALSLSHATADPLLPYAMSPTVLLPRPIDTSMLYLRVGLVSMLRCPHSLWPDVRGHEDWARVRVFEEERKVGLHAHRVDLSAPC